MSITVKERPSPLLEAITKLAAIPATELREDICFRLPVTMRIADADLCSYLARNQSSFLFLPDQNTFNTRLILRTTNEAWKQAKLPTVAICPTERSVEEVQRTTGIESVSAERFFSDLSLARPITQTFTGKKSFVIGHDENPSGKFDDIVLPSLANVIAYNAQEFSSQQLASLCEPISQVRGRLILCGDWTAMERAHPDIAQTISDALGYGLPDIPVGNNPERAWELGNKANPPNAADEFVPLSNDSACWVVVANSPTQIGANWVRSIHASQKEALNAVPAVFAEEWKDYLDLHQADWTDRDLPSISAAEWRLPTPPKIGDSVRIENHAAVSLISKHERLPLPEAIRGDTRDTDPLAKRRPFLVFHANSEDSKLFPDDYTLVARINAENIDHALILSQHTGVKWTQYPGVTSFTDKPRSTQAGDVIIDHDLPVRFVGPNRWCPVTTAADQADISATKTDLNTRDYKPDAHEHHISRHKLKV
jgi:hypothetical protein